MMNLAHKPVASRVSRPSWATNDKQILEHIMQDDKGSMRRFKIATMYWKQNMSARDIATSLDITINAVKKVLQRLRCR